MKKYFIFSDVHGHFDELISALKSSGFDIKNEEHIIISLGDNFDRGKQNFKVFQFLKSFPVHRKFLIKGNHEILLEHLVDRYDALPHDRHNGTLDAYLEFRRELGDPKISEVIEFNKTFLNYLEIQNHIFTHAFIPNNYKKATQEEWDDAVWIDSRTKLDELIKKKTIVVGHIASKLFHGLSEIYIKEDKGNLIAIDSRTILSKKINILVMNEDGTYDNEKEGCMLKQVSK